MRSVGVRVTIVEKFPQAELAAKTLPMPLGTTPMKMRSLPAVSRCRRSARRGSRSGIERGLWRSSHIRHVLATRNRQFSTGRSDIGASGLPARSGTAARIEITPNMPP